MKKRTYQSSINVLQSSQNPRTLTLHSPIRRAPLGKSVSLRAGLLLEHPLRDFAKRKLIISRRPVLPLHQAGPPRRVLSPVQSYTQFATPSPPTKKVASCVHLEKYLASDFVAKAKPPLCESSVAVLCGGNADIPRMGNATTSSQSEGVVKAYAANTHQGLVRYCI